jgi:hypothetical protein
VSTGCPAGGGVVLVVVVLSAVCQLESSKDGCASGDSGA